MFAWRPIEPGLLRDLASLVADDGGNIVEVRHIDGPQRQMHLDVSGIAAPEQLLVAHFGRR